MTISAFSRGSDSASTNACSRSRSDLSKSFAELLAEPPQHLRAFGTGWELLEQRLEDRTRPLRIPARIVMVGREELPAAQDLPAGHRLA